MDPKIAIYFIIEFSRDQGDDIGCSSLKSIIKKNQKLTLDFAVRN